MGIVESRVMPLRLYAYRRRHREMPDAPHISLDRLTRKEKKMTAVIPLRELLLRDPQEVREESARLLQLQGRDAKTVRKLMVIAGSQVTPPKLFALLGLLLLLLLLRLHDTVVVRVKRRLAKVRVVKIRQMRTDFAGSKATPLKQNVQQFLRCRCLHR